MRSLPVQYGLTGLMPVGVMLPFTALFVIYVRCVIMWEEYVTIDCAQRTCAPVMGVGNTPIMLCVYQMDIYLFREHVHSRSAW